MYSTSNSLKTCTCFTGNVMRGIDDLEALHANQDSGERRALRISPE